MAAKPAERFEEVQISHFIVEDQFGAIHRPVNGQYRQAVVVLCPPLGREGRSLYRANYEWANMLARNGFPTIRFDLRGTGDSGETRPGIDNWSDWISGVAAIASFARETTRTERLCLAGFRLGGLLAGCAAEAVNAEDLMLLAPHSDGSIWLRELQLEVAIRGGSAGRDGEYNGIMLDLASERAVAAVKMPDRFPSVRSAFIASAIHKSLARQFAGVACTTQPFPNWNSFFTDSHLVTPPWDILGAATDWISRQVEGVSEQPRKPVKPLATARLSGDQWVETPIEFGSGLRGVLTMPRSPTTSTVVIFGNVAADPRAGASAYCTAIARGLADLGISTFRFDFRGLGESDARGNDRPHVYETSRVGDFKAAATMLARHGYADYVLAGVCSGGYHAVEAALSDPTFKAAIAFNSWIVWHPGPLDVEAQATAMRSIQMSLKGARHKVAWLRSRISGRAAAMRKVAASWLQERGRGEVQKRLQAAAKRGAQLHLVFGWRDRALDGFWSDFGPMGILFRRHEGCTARVLTGLDHSFLSRRSRAIAVREIHAFLHKLKLDSQRMGQTEASWNFAPPAKPTRRTSRSSRT